MTGYNIPNHIIVFTDIQTIKDYEIAYDNNFSEDILKSINWNTRTNNRDNSKGTMNL